MPWVSRSLSVFWTQLEFLKRNVLGYVCNPSSSKERDAASRGHTSGIPASGCFIPEADAGSTARAFMLPGRLRHPPVTSRPSVGQITHVFRARLRWWHSLSVFWTQRLVPSRNWGYIRNLRRYSHIMLKSVNIPSCIISSVCVTAQIFSRLTILDNVLHLLPDSEGQVAQVSWHMNQSSRRRLWIRL